MKTENPEIIAAALLSDLDLPRLSVKNTGIAVSGLQIINKEIK
jgi:hypothetical protein